MNAKEWALLVLGIAIGALFGWFSNLSHYEVVDTMGTNMHDCLAQGGDYSLRRGSDKDDLKNYEFCEIEKTINY